jgi:hypothetical protein
MPEPIQIKVLHNHKNFFLPVLPEDTFIQVAQFEIHVHPECFSGVVELVFQQLNVDEPVQPWAIEYRRKRHRSLSVGDVVIVGETAWAVEPLGFKQVTVRGDQVWFDMGLIKDDQ